jgi:hypothetical protein
MRDRHTALQLCKTCWPQLVATAGHNCIVSSLRVRVNERQTHRTATRSSNAGDEDKPLLGRYGHSWLQLATAGKIFPSWLRCADGEADGCIGALRLCSAQNEIRSITCTDGSNGRHYRHVEVVDAGINTLTRSSTQSALDQLQDSEMR